MQASPLIKLSSDVRLRILSQVPVSQLAALQPLARFLHADIAHLWTTRAFAEVYLDRVLTRLREEHVEVVCWHVQASGCDTQERAAQVGHLLQLLHLMRWLHACREQLGRPAMIDTALLGTVVLANKASRRLSHDHTQMHPEGLALIKEVYKRVRSARRKRSGLWSPDVQKLLYPGTSLPL